MQRSHRYIVYVDYLRNNVVEVRVSCGLLSVFVRSRPSVLLAGYDLTLNHEVVTKQRSCDRC